MIGKPIDQSIKLGNWCRSIDDQSITTQKSFIDWHRLEQDLETDVTHATCPIIRQFWEALETKLVKQFGPSQRKEYIPLHVFSNYPLARHCLSFPCHNVFVRRLGKGFTGYKVHRQRPYRLCRFEVNVGEVFSANKKRGERIFLQVPVHRLRKLT